MCLPVCLSVCLSACRPFCPLSVCLSGLVWSELTGLVWSGLVWSGLVCLSVCLSCCCCCCVAASQAVIAGVTPLRLRVVALHKTFTRQYAGRDGAAVGVKDSVTTVAPRPRVRPAPAAGALVALVAADTPLSGLRLCHGSSRQRRWMGPSLPLGVCPFHLCRLHFPRRRCSLRQCQERGRSRTRPWMPPRTLSFERRVVAAPVARLLWGRRAKALDGTSVPKLIPAVEILPRWPSREDLPLTPAVPWTSAWAGRSLRGLTPRLASWPCPDRQCRGLTSGPPSNVNRV